MKKIFQLIALPVLVMVSMACKKAVSQNGEQVPIAVQASATPAQEKLSLNDTSLKKVIKTDAQWKKSLTSNQYYILRKKGTETPFNNEFNGNHEKGHYFCAGCNLPLFSSDAKFESGTGWPSFFQPIANSRVKVVTDNSLGMIRGEIVCARCDGHIGHVFDDGPKPTGLRYCMNSGAMLFKKS